MFSKKTNPSLCIFYGGYMLVAALMSKGCEKRRGLTISLALSVACLGQFVLVPIFNRFILTYNWRTSSVLIALIILGVTTILALAVLKGDPPDMGLKPHGYNPADEAADSQEPENSKPLQKDLNLLQALKTDLLWLFLLFMFICGGGLLFDKSGSYQIIFTLSAAMAVIAMTSALTIKEKRHVMRWLGKIKACRPSTMI